DGDVTTEATVDGDAVGTAELLVKEPGVVCGLAAAEAVFRALDPGLRFESLVDEGSLLEAAPAAVAGVSGPLRAILTGERTSLNFLGRFSGIATGGRRCVARGAGAGGAVLG